MYGVVNIVYYSAFCKLEVWLIVKLDRRPDEVGEFLKILLFYLCRIISRKLTLVLQF